MPKPSDFSFDRIGERLDHPDRDPILSADDLVRVQWIEKQWAGCTRLLDVGASDGALTERFLKQSPEHEAVVIEPHPEQAAALLVRLRPYLDRVVFYFCPIERAVLLGLNVKWPDCVLMGEVLEHIDGAETVVGYVTPIGEHQRLVVTVPNRRSASYDGSGRSRWEWPDHKRWFDTRELADLLQYVGGDELIITPIVGEVNDSIWLGAVCR